MGEERCECYAVVHVFDSRYDLWREVDPEARMPLKHPVPHRNEDGRFYEGDLDRLSDEQKATMYDLLAEKFGVSPGEIREEFESLGYFPVMEPVSLAICRLHTRCMM